MLIHFDNNAGFQSDYLIELANSRRDIKVGIIDADLLDGGTRHPNLALLKIAGYCKGLGFEVNLLEKYADLHYNDDIDAFIEECEFDVLAISQVFKFTVHPPFIDSLIDKGYIFWGGTGFKEVEGPQLPDVVEHHKPDYSLYDSFIEHATGGDSKAKKRDWDDYLSYSIGFTTRGCIRHCAFCVNRESNGVVRWSNVNEFLDVSRPRIYLWDDNILAAPPRVLNDVINQLKATNKPFQFRQGLDIRLLNDAKAKMLCDVHYYGDFIFAFDHYRRDDVKELRNVESTIRGLQVWRKYNNKPTKLYVLAGFDGIDANDIRGVFWRIKVLMYYGCLPYIMRYENYVNSEYQDMYIQIARWCNQPSMFKKMTFREFILRNEEVYQKPIKPGKHCAPYRAMKRFEEAHPEIAAEFFNLRYDPNRRLYFCGKDIQRVPLSFFDSWDGKYD